MANSGDYASGWWWYYGLTAAQIDSRLADNEARLLDIEPYTTASGVRYAAVMVPDSGEQSVAATDWETGYTFAQVTSWVAANPNRRIHDIEPYEAGPGVRYAFTWISNTGGDTSSWWYYLNTSRDFIVERIADNGARLVDLERHADGNWSAVMVPTDGNAWYWFTGVDPSDAGDLAVQYAGRIVDIERYGTDGGDRIAMVVRRNANDLTVDTNIDLRADLPIATDSGLLLGRLGGATRASVRSTDTFEPASLLKTFHHFHAMRQVALGNDSLGNAVIFPDGGDTVCPSPDDPLNAQLLQETLRKMMEDSSNPATEAIRQRYGSAAIEATASGIGATETALEHVIGCFCNSTRNQTTLAGLRTLHDAAVSGLLGGFVSQFHSLMLQNYADFPAIVQGELATSSLSIAERDQFEALAYAAGKGGSYTCNDALNEGVFRSRGAYFRVPFKEGCDIVDREYFAGAWINDAPSDSGGVASDNCDAAMESLFADRIRAAIRSWETADCIPCPGDFNGDGVVDGADIGILLAEWGSCAKGCIADVDGDGDVDGADLGRFLALWGPCPR
ncbi:MAG: hypothetical protein GWP75_10440 [Planctomycetia bacterium]|nr:hypothetical protein [Planctomycetia bacterium]